MKTQVMMKKQHIYFIILMAFLMMAAGNAPLFAQHEHHEHEHGDAKAPGATFNWNIGKGNVEFYMSSGTLKYSGYTSDGTHQTGDHNTSNIYNISGSASSSLSGGDAPVIKIGTSSTAVNQDIVIYLDGPTIWAPHRDNDNHAAPIYVNNSAGTVYIVLKDGTTTSLKGYGQSNYKVNASGTSPAATSVSYAHSAIEKEMDANGTLVITCEAGYANYKNNNNTGHTCTEGGSCGELEAIASGATYRPPGGGTLSIFCGAAIGTAGRKSGTLNNLVIAGGQIEARVMWDNMNNGTPASLSGEDKSSYAPGIGVGAAGGASQSSVPAGNIKITGGKIIAKAGNGSPSCIGGGYRSGNITVDIYGGNITATERVYTDANHRGAGIGAGGGGDSSSAEGTGTVNIYGGTITASSQYGAAIGGGAGGGSGSAQPAVVTISGGTVTATTTVGGGAAIGAGGSTGTGGAAQATVTIEGGTVSASSRYGADIGGGGTNSSSVNAEGGKGIVTISGGSITTTKGGIGGGNANAGPGGDADVTVTGGTISTTSIGGGNSTSNTGGDASIYITGGSLTCKKFIGGGDSDTGTPGSVSSSVSGRAGVHITGSNKITLKAGYIGGGTNTAGDIGKATVYINATHAQSTIQGQFILSSTSSTTSDHCYFTMTGGTIDNTDLGAVGASSYPRKKADGGAVYMTDNYGVVSISGGTIKNCTAPNGHGGAVYMDKTSGTFNGSFTLSGSAVIESCQATGSVEDGQPGRGGAVFMSAGSFTMSGGQIRKCTAQNRGGAVYQSGGTMTISGGTIGGVSLEEGNQGLHGGGVYTKANFTMTGGNVKYNQATASNSDGGGLCISSGADVNIKGGTIEGNQSNRRGGGLYLNPGSSRTIYINSKVQTMEITSNSAQLGAGAYVNSGTLNINSEATTISNNISSDLGGGVYVNGGTVNDTASIISGNTAANDGGGIYSAGGTVNLISARVNDNTATSGNGGGVYATSPVNVKGATISGNKAENGTNGLGGGIYAAAGAGNSITIESTSSISGNSAKNGGGVYANSGDVNILTNSKIFGNTASNSGGGIYANGGTTTINCTSAGYIGASDNPNTAKYGGGIYAEGGTTNVTSGFLQYNNATKDGGGIYANGGTVNVQYSNTTDGTVRYNSASERGGGLFISATGVLYLKNKAKVEKNRVPLRHNGGGIYLLGKVQAGSSSKSSDVIIVDDNYADVAGATVTASNRNNIYLPNPTVNSAHKDVITIVANGLDISSTGSHIGFSVPGNYVPVIYCSDKSYLNSNQASIINRVFEDSERFHAVYYPSTSPFDPYYIYLYAETWVTTVFEQPASGYSLDESGNVTISSPEGLAWLISRVNGSNGETETKSDFSDKKITLAADLDLSAHSWVPIGFDGSATFNGEFDGNGHVISGLYCSYMAGDIDAGTGKGLGLFGVASGANIHDLFLRGAHLLVTNQVEGTYAIGAIANELTGGGTIYNCIVDATLEATIASTTMGGLVGKLTNGTVHSSSATPTMSGYQMGGLVGANGGNLYNSYANASFSYDGTEQYFGGLVGVNSGTVQNCYTRVRDDVPSSTYFGWVTGSNKSASTAGTVSACYIPTGYSNYISTSATGNSLGGSISGHGTYAPTVTPYGYKSYDNLVTLNGELTTSGALLDKLNDGLTSGWTSWMRTSASPINGDYPIHHYTDFVNVASLDNVILEYSADFNTKFEEYISAADGTIYLYANPLSEVTPSLSNSSGAPALYIQENVVMRHSSDIKAHVGITLDNSAGSGGATPSFGGSDVIDWHFFSSALADAPIGLTYGDEEPYGQYETPSWNATFTDPDGYFPTNLDSYYGEWDLYAYYEPEYHWINLKRNSASHWHEDFANCPITYPNDETFKPGHGYMVALAEEGYLQAYGTLNTHTTASPLSVALDYTPDISWTNRQGHNLLGNPYQSYLDFDLFAEYNPGLWKDNKKENAYYIIMDEDQQGYIYYGYNASANTYTAPKFLHPHQGFMVIVTEKSLSAKFDDRMRNTTATGVTFRDDQPHYPLVNLFATDDKGNRDMVTVELGRPDKGGAIKQGGLRAGKGNIYCHYEDEDYAIAFTQPGLEEASIRFATAEDCAYTMKWNTQNGEFDYLHLIDNLTGLDIDCLTTEKYIFFSKTSDYKSRFRLKFKCSEEDNEDTSSNASNFAFILGDELVVNGEGTLQLIDLNGRIVSKEMLHGSQSSVHLPNTAAGVYLLHLTDSNGTRIQKIILD